MLWSWHVFSKAKPRGGLTLFRRRISAHSVAFLVNQAVNSHYSHHVFILFVTNDSNTYHSDPSHIVIYISYPGPPRSRLRGCISTTNIQSFEPTKPTLSHTSYRTYNITTARQTHNLKKIIIRLPCAPL